LLLVAAGKQQEDRPGLAQQCIRDIQSNLAATAKHLQVDLKWQIEPDLTQFQVADTSSLAAAVTNLVMNAMQAGTMVEVNVTIEKNVAIDQNVIGDQDVTGDQDANILKADCLRVEVVDNGPGPPSEIADQIFDPFITSKPEGLGLGLPLVKRSAERLGGRVEWKRVEPATTRFVLYASIWQHHA
jgi:signal transduction histidine kinase